MGIYHYHVGQHVPTPDGWGVIVGQTYLDGKPTAIVLVDGTRRPYSETEIMAREAEQMRGTVDGFKA